MAKTMSDGHLGFVHLKEIDPPTIPRPSGRYLDRWVGVWEDAHRGLSPFEEMARDLGEFWVLDRFFGDGIKGYVTSTAGIWLSESPVSFLESAVFLASHARHPRHIENLNMKREVLFRRLRDKVQGAPADAMQRLGARAAVYRADLADALFDVAHGMLASDIPGAGTLRNEQPVPPAGWIEQLGWSSPATGQGV